MFDHLVFSVSNYEESKTFFLKALDPIGIKVITEDDHGIELSADDEVSLCLRNDGVKTTPLHLAFVAQSRDQVEQFYKAALAAGGVDNGPPDIREAYSKSYYAAFVICPEGHNIEMVFHESS